MSEDIKFEVNQGWGDFKIVWMMKRAGGKMYNGYLENGNIKWVEVTDSAMKDDQIPFLKVPGWGIDLGGLVEALTDKVPTEKETATTAELRATKYHLEDMRKLMKIK